MKLHSLCVAMAAFALCISARAASLKQDTQEFRVDGHFDPQTENGGDFQVNLTYGYFVADNIEVGGRTGYHNNDNATLFSVGPFAELNFDLGSELVPFVGSALEYATGDTSYDNNDALALSLYGGAKYFLSENIAIGAKLQFSVASDKIYASNKGSDSTDIVFEFGMSYYLP